MRIEYSGTLIEQILELNKSRSIDFVYLDTGEFYSMLVEAGQKGLLDSQAGVQWLTIKDCDIVFYLDPDA